MGSFLENTYSAINSGLLFIPFAIGISLIYRNLKEIDISIDGVIVISGIVSALVWNVTDSYVISLVSGALSGLLCSLFVASLTACFSVPALMSGLIFSLIAHTVSIFWIGESITLTDTALIRTFTDNSVNLSLWHFAVLLSCYLVPIYFYSSHMGLSVRKLGNDNTTNLYYSAAKLRFSAYALTGTIYGVGAAIFVHSRGTASAGAGFEYLVHALTAYLLVSKFFPVIAEAFSSLSKRIEAKLFPKKYTAVVDCVLMVISYESLMAPVGAILLEVIITHVIDFSTITKSTQVWKLALSIVLLIVLSTWPPIRKRIGRRTRQGESNHGISISYLDFSYKFAGGRRVIFSNVDVDFSLGLNILMGPNGSGKTTLLKLISGELLPHEGAVYHSGEDVTYDSTHDRSVYILMQNPLHTLVPEMTVQENLFLAWERPSSMFVNGKTVSLRRMQACLRQSGLELIADEDDQIWTRPVESLSGGQAYCVAIYAAVLSGRQVILADEPTTGLDPSNYNMVKNALKHLGKNSERTVVIVTHDDRLKDITWNKYYIRDEKIQAESNWWDARYSETFFSSVYRLGDESQNGFLNDKPMDLFQRTQREVVLVCRLIGDPDNKKILDCPCGYGRHAIELSRKNALVHGIDISPKFIQEARMRAELELPSEKRPVFLEGDMRKLPGAINDAYFDHCLSMFFSFGFFEDEENQATLCEYFKVLKEGGTLIIHSDVNPDLINNGSYGDPRKRELQNRMELHINERFNAENQRLEGSWTIKSGESVLKAQQYSVRIYQHNELIKMLKDAGFSKVDIDYPSDSNKQEVIYIATK